MYFRCRNVKFIFQIRNESIQPVLLDKYILSLEKMKFITIYHPKLVSGPILVVTFFVNLWIPCVIQTSALKDNSLGDLELYKISWKGPLKDDVTFNEDNVVRIATQANEKYICVVPNSSDQTINFDYSAKNESSQDKEANDNPKDINPIKLLEPLLKGNVCSYKYELYWIYELCHGKFLRQYHEEGAKLKSKISQEYYLGRMEPEQITAHEEEYTKRSLDTDQTGQSTRPTILIDGHHKPFITLNMTAGTICDLTKRSRASKIIYACNEEPKNELYSIKETSTCEYEAIVLSPLLCKHKDFRVDTSTQHEIKCYSIDGSPLRPEKTLEPGEDDESKDALDRRRVIHIDHEVFYFVNLIPT